MRELFQSIGAGYRLFWLAVATMARGFVAIGGVIVLTAVTVLAGKSPTDVVPYAVLWLLAGGTCRMLLRILPVRAMVDRLPTERSPPPAMLAVSITPVGPEGSCSPVSQLTVSLPQELRELLGPIRSLQ